MATMVRHDSRSAGLLQGRGIRHVWLAGGREHQFMCFSSQPRRTGGLVAEGTIHWRGGEREATATGLGRHGQVWSRRAGMTAGVGLATRELEGRGEGRGREALSGVCGKQAWLANHGPLYLEAGGQVRGGQEGTRCGFGRLL